MSADVLQEYASLEEQVLAALRPDLTENEFDALALEIHAFQRKWNAPYRAWCEQQPAPRRWKEIPAVPQATFKRYRLSCFPPELVTKTFRTSGTTGETRGEHHLRDTRLYEAAILAGWPRPPAQIEYFVFLTPSPLDAPDSSLFHMFGTLARDFRDRPFGEGFFMCDARGKLEPDRLKSLFFELIRPSERVAVFGTALSFLNFFEWLGERAVRLKKGSYAVETGGFKGSGRDIPKEDLYRKFEEHLGLPPQRIWNEYGMCELSSQFYTNELGNPHQGGPWVRAVVVSPETGNEVDIGETGVLRIFDLANVGSVLAIQTADLATRTPDGFILLGRDPAATPRGCSRMADEAMRTDSAGTRPSNVPIASGKPRSAVRRPARKLPELGNTAQRAAVLAEAASHFPFLGPVTSRSLLDHVRLELGHENALDQFVPYGAGQTRAVSVNTILHILSGNTPAAALQTIIRGLLLGARNRCKLPSAGLPEVEQFVARLPAAWRSAVELSPELPDHWIRDADAVIVFGSDATVEHFRAQISASQIFVAHGHKLSLGLIVDDPEYHSMAGAARDASVFDQLGCLSPVVFYARERGDFTAERYARELAREMERFAAAEPPGARSISEANAIRSAREELRFRKSNGEPIDVFASENLDWTVAVDRSPEFPKSPLHRFIYVKPVPSDLAKELEPVRASISTISVWPSTPENAILAMELGAERICAIGSMQSPPLAWHHDGQATLAPFARWVDWEG